MPLPGENPMIFKNLPKEKRTHLVLVFLITIAVAAGLGFGLIKRQYENLSHLSEKRATAEAKLHKIKDAVQHETQIDADLGRAQKTIAEMEEDMASGDLYSWVIDALRRFKLGYKVDLHQFSPISSPGEVDLLPEFPYKQASLTVLGSAHYHELGHFLADFENAFPHMRILNLNASGPSVAPSNEDQETVSFTMQIVTLVKPNAS
jgi:Tfp pilus assembly protein PilO